MGLSAIIGGMSWCSICGEDDHGQQDCELRLGNRRPPDQAGLLPQYRRCRTCQQVTHAWDNMPCGQHSVPGAELPRGEAPPVTPPRPRRGDLRALALQQAAESRASRLACLDQPRRHQHPHGHAQPDDDSEQYQPGSR